MASFLLDTNILSELFKPEPSPAVLNWIKHKDPADLYLSAITLAELRLGAVLLPQGKKRLALETWVEQAVLSSFQGRLLSFDGAASAAWAQLVAEDKKRGRPRPTLDSMIAAIALSHRLTLVTRNVKDFDGLGLKIINPFERQA
ncbi:MAG: type II toxin-antitoxin system VapC family toxin [Alphaproteobacteria bacterium]|nr:type II toxin-antitoxin system VapC family toxin [Alphaproteobacteria bacterium]